MDNIKDTDAIKILNDRVLLKVRKIYSGYHIMKYDYELFIKMTLIIQICLNLAQSAFRKHTER